MYRSKETIDFDLPPTPISRAVSDSSVVDADNTIESGQARSASFDVDGSTAPLHDVDLQTVQPPPEEIGSQIDPSNQSLVLISAATPPPRLSTDPSTVDVDVTRRSATSFASTSAGRAPLVQYHRKQRRKLHPLQEVRSVIDVWPAPRPSEKFAAATSVSSAVASTSAFDRADINGNLQTTTASMPQLLVDIISEVKNKLQRLVNAQPQFSNLCDNNVPTLADFDDAITATKSRSRRSPERGQQRTRSPPRQTGESTSMLVSINSPSPVMGATKRPPHHLHNRSSDGPLAQQQPKLQPMFARSIDGAPLAGKSRSPPPASHGIVSLVDQRRTTEDSRKLNNKTVVGSTASVVDVSTSSKQHNGNNASITSSTIRRKSELNHIKRTPEDVFRHSRLAIFEGAGRDFAKHFPTYRLLLEWIFREFRAYEGYCHQHVVSPEMRAQFESDLRQEMLEDFADERARLTFELKDTKEKLDDVTNKYQQLKYLSQTAERRIAEKDDTIAARDAEITENNAGRVALLSRVQRLEKELWAQRDAMEGPETIIANLRKEVKSLEERFAYANKAVEESNMDKAVLKVRLERLEDILKERKLRQAQTVPKSELLIYKKAQIDILELNAQLEAKLLKIRGAYRGASEELQRLKSGQAPGTPRPPWHLADDIFPAATTTAQRVHLAMREYRGMQQANQMLTKEVEDLKKIVAMIPRGDGNEGCEYILFEMQIKHFYKLGFEGSVPSFLRGTGKATNLKLTVEETGGYCRMLFLHRESVRPSSAAAESVFESFATKYAPSHVSAQDFAYSMFYAMRWFAFDPFIGLMRKYLTSQIDSTVLAHMEKIVFGCKLFIQSAADENNLGTGSPPASPALGSATTNAGSDPVVDSKPTEHIRRKSVRHLINAAEAEAAAEKALDTKTTNNLAASFGAQALIVEEPRLLYKAEILPLIADYFCAKSEEQLKLIVGKISMDYPGVQVDSRALFRFVMAKKRFSLFVEEVLRQTIIESEELATEYALCIQSVTNPEGHCVPQGVAKAIWAMDPLAPAAYMDDLLSDIFEVSVEELHPSLVEGSYYKTPGAEGERCYNENSEDPLMAEEKQVVDRLRRRVLRRFCPKHEVETEKNRMLKEAERAKERAEMDF
ncbi:Hypothetical protein, putative [Bodo saltans]|uniref:Translin-associated factor X-interacting protein 1 N-terminal domain-containing protein n=1 Tax=Bodo saltans TaxID=75058 RepID=A0A0S4JEE4_BODSA|nr:Hypothetical protein, putative [Bodo saltans]|eukprot:CUG88540.1 Hypothetical protein, putative [Bodo saltans]